MERVEQIIISRDFSDTPGARYKTDGEFSGEQFYEELLSPRFESALQKKGILFIDFDDTWGYPSSFLSGSFGELSNNFGSQVCFAHLEFKSDDDPNLIKEIERIISNPESR